MGYKVAVLDLPARRVNLLLAVFVWTCLVTGVTSWAIGTNWARPVTVFHGISGLGLLVLAPVKLTRSVRSGMRRRRPTRWLSVLFGVMVTATVVLGLLHATGLWFGVGYWTALWTHVLLAFSLIPLFLWHLGSRPIRPRATDVDRRALVTGGAVVGVAAATYGAQELVVEAVGLAGRDRRFTGSHEVASHDPSAMPSVSWINDEAPATPDAEWHLTLLGEAVDLDSLRRRARPVVAALDCTGGWFSEQSWDVVSVAELLEGRSARSIRIVSATGYERLFPFGDAEHLHLAVGYEGESLRRRHGGPIRIVAPARRGPWWVKWVTRVDLTDRPWWFQFPFPLS
jgi:hypothetical protein